MHARQIIQDFLTDECRSMHARRRNALALMTEAARRGGLGMLKMSKALSNRTSLRHRIKCCDRLLSNPHLEQERVGVYRALARRILGGRSEVGIIIDWSDLLDDISEHVIRAAVVVEGRAIVVYEEIHPTNRYGSPLVHREFMKTLRTILPANCSPIILTDAGFRATWFKMLDELGFLWIGRIRNRDMVCEQIGGVWRGCKELYPAATATPSDLGQFKYARANPVACRLVMIKRKPRGRKSLTVFGKRSSSRHNQKQRSGQTEPWLLAVSPSLARMNSRQIVAWYATRMQIEQTFRDLKSPQWGMGLSTSQTRKPKRLTILLLIAALVTFALWLIGLVVRKSGYKIQYGSARKANNTLSVLSLARQWLLDNVAKRLPRSHIDEGLAELTTMLRLYKI